MYHLVHKIATLRGDRGTVMQQEFSLAYLTAPGLDPPEMIDIAVQAGFPLVGLRLSPVVPGEREHPLASRPALLRKTRSRLRETGIGVLDVELFRLAPDFDIGRQSRLLDACAELGARHLIAQAPDSDLARAIDHFSQLCEHAARRALTVELEFVTWTQTRDLARAAQIVAGAARPNGGILIDVLHFARSGCVPEEIARLPARWFRYVQICDAPRAAPDSEEGLIHAARCDRLYLGEGELDVAGILSALPDGLPCSIEIPRTALARAIGPVECARLALVSARRYIEALEPPKRAGGRGAPLHARR